MNTDALAIIVPGATAVLLAGISVWYQRWLTDKTLGQQAELTQKTLDHERTIARDQRVHETSRTPTCKCSRCSTGSLRS
jgi:hypothetical protein